VFTNYPRFFDVVVGDALYFDAPFINFCLDHHKHVIVTAKGENRLLVQDAAGLFAQQPPGRWVDNHGKRTVQFWDEEGFTSCEGVKPPLRFLRTEETVHKRERIAGQWQETDETTIWSWATTLTKAQLSTRGLWRCGHARWDIENDCFNTLATHWGLNHCFKHTAEAIVNFLLTSFVVYALLQSFWLRNLKPALRAGLTLIALARELDRGLVGCRAPWSGWLARAP
jgi:Transposase DDE domain